MLFKIELHPFILPSDRALNLIGTQASRTDVHMARRTVNDRLHALDVGLPAPVGPTMRVGDLDTERNALAANIALCHQLHLLATGKSIKSAVPWTPNNIVTDVSTKSKHKFEEFLKISFCAPKRRV